MDPGHLIAIQLTLLYTILGPLVLLAIYALFDILSRPGDTEDDRLDSTNMDPALWTGEEVDEHFNRI